MKRKPTSTFCALPLLILLPACASTATRATAKPEESSAGPVAGAIAGSAEGARPSEMAALSARIDSLETKLATLGDRLLATQGSLDQLLANSKALPTAVHEHPAEAAGARPPTPASPRDPEAGFATDEAIQAFRKASIQWQAGKFADAVLSFSSFLERYPDHALAGTAQYYVGNAYFQQKEYKLAVQEYSRVLTSYDRSAHVSDTLAEMARAEEALKNPEGAARHRQLLTSLFPQSPAAALVAAAETARSAGTPAPDKREAPAASPLPTAPLPAAERAETPAE